MKIVIAMLLALGATDVMAWQGYDKEFDSQITIPEEGKVHLDRDLEILDHKTNSYKEVRVEAIRNGGSSVEIEVFDYELNKYRIFEMN